MPQQEVSKSSAIESLREKRKPVIWIPSTLSAVKELDPDRVVIGDIESALSGVSYRQLLRDLKIPKSFYDSLDAKVRSKVLAHQRGLYGDVNVKVRFSEDRTECQAVVPPAFSEVKAEDLLEQLPDWPCVEISGDFNSPAIHYRAAFKELEIDENTHVAFDFTMSEVGACDLSINALIYVVVCTNGAIRTRASKPYFSLPMTVMEGAEFQAVSSLLADRLVSDHERLAQRILETKSEKVKLEEIIDFWLQSKNIPKVVPKKTMARAESDQIGSEVSVYDLIQLVSNVGRHLASYPTRVHFETVAGNLLNVPITDPATLVA